MGFPSGSAVNIPPVNERDVGSVPGSGRSSGEGNSNPLQYSCLLLLLSLFSRVWLCATPLMAAHQAPPSLGFSRLEHWSALPFPSPMHESDKWKWSRLVVPDPQRPHRLQPSRLFCPWDFPGKRVLEWSAVDIKQCEISQSQKDKYCMIPLTLNIKSRFTEPEITMVMFPETRRRQKIGSC